jgi:hypothetical protein
MECRSFSACHRSSEKELAITRRGFGILVDGDDDRLHMLIAPAFSHRETASYFERL